MKTLILFNLILISSFNFFGSTDLDLGDVAFVDYQSDDSDRFTFVIFQDVDATTTLTFNENGWFATGGFRTGEGTLTWTSGVAILAGTLIEIIGVDGDFSASTGTVIETGAFSLSIAGDQILVYQGTVPVAGDESNFITGIQMNSAWDADAINPNTSAQPSVLVDGINSISISPEIDNVQYDFEFNTGTVDQLRSAIFDQSNFVRSNDSQSPVLGTENLTVVLAGPLPVTLSYFRVDQGKNGSIILEWETTFEENNSHFEILRSIDSLSLIHI